MFHKLILEIKYFTLMFLEQNVTQGKLRSIKSSSGGVHHRIYLRFLMGFACVFFLW